MAMNKREQNALIDVDVTRRRAHISTSHHTHFSFIVRIITYSSSAFKYTHHGAMG